MTDIQQPISTGTTIVAVTYDGGVMVAADTRTSSGTYVSNRAANKLSVLCDNALILRSGSAASTQATAYHVSHYLDLHQHEDERMPTIKTVSRFVQQIAYHNKDSLSMGVIVAGWDDKKGGQIFAIPMGGVMTERQYAFGGSGSAYVYGYIDKHWQSGMSEEQCRQWLVNVVSMAISRDGSSGGGIRLAKVDKNGIKHETIRAEHVLVGYNELPQPQAAKTAA